MHEFLFIVLLLAIDPSKPCTLPSFAELEVPSNFSLHRFLGRWYEIKWYADETEPDSEIWDDFSQTFELENHSTERLLAFGNARLSYETECFAFGPWSIIVNNSAKMILEKKDSDILSNLNWPYYILKTDYNHYALIYGCMTENYTLEEPCKQPVLWLFSRTVLLSSEYLIELDDYIEDVLCLNLTEIEITLHTAKSCHVVSAMGRRISLMKMDVCFLLPILYFFLTYK